MTQQVFIFLFALLLVALVLVFGVKQLLLVMSTADKVETLKFVDDFRKQVQTYAGFGIGSSKQLIIPLPSTVDQVCFFTPGQPLTGISDPVLRALLQSERKNNFYLLPLEQFQNPGPGFTIPYLVVRGPKNPLCILTPNDLRVQITTIEYQGGISVEVRPL